MPNASATAMLAANVNMSGFDRRIASLREGADAAGAAAARSGADHFIEFMVLHSPVDTGRYKRGWIQAGNMAGLTQRRLPALKPGKFAKEIEPALDRQIDRLIDDIRWRQRKLDRWYHDKGRKPDKFYRRLQREINADTRRLIRAVDQKRRFLGADAPLLVFDLFSNARTKTVNGKTKRLRLTTIRDKVYGGWGEQVTIDGETRVRLANREPHVRLVERRYRLVSRARAAVRRHTEAEVRKIRLERA